MTQYSWPDPALRPLLGKKIDRVDGPSKSSGRAKYTYDYNPQGLLAGKILHNIYRITIVSYDDIARKPALLTRHESERAPASGMA